MDSSEGPAQRPVTLDITDVAEPDKPQDPVPDPAEVSSTSTIPGSDVLFPEESIDLGGEPFSSPQDDSLASGSLMDKLNDQMMESVMISDSPNNSEEDDVVPMDSLLEQFDDSQTPESKEPEEKVEEGEKTEPQATEEQTTTEIKMESPEESSTTAGETSVEEKVEEKKGDESQEGEKETSVSVQPPDDSPGSGGPEAQDADLGTSQQTPAKEEPIPVCTIFSQGQPPKTLVPDSFQPTLVKSPSFSSGSGSGAAETPSKLAPLVCQPSPSLSKFFSDNGGVNPASDFFDSFTTSSSFISVSNPNAESPKAPATPERQVSSSSSSSTGPVMPAAALPQESTTTPSSYFAAPPADSTPKPPSAGPAEATPPPFSKLQAVFSGSDDPFATALSMSEVDRRHDAWLPSEETRKVLISVATQQINTSHVERERLSMPGLKFDNLQVSLLHKVAWMCIVKVLTMHQNGIEC